MSEGKLELKERVLELESQLKKAQSDVCLLKAILNVVRDDLKLKHEQFDVLYPCVMSSSLLESRPMAPSAKIENLDKKPLFETNDCTEELKPLSRVYDLPCDLDRLILSFCDFHEICALSQVNRSWMKTCRTSKLWQVLFRFRWPRLYREEKLDEEVFWKTKFKRNWKIENAWKDGKCSIVTLGGHTGTITGLQFKDSMMISGSDDGSLIMWRLNPVVDQMDDDSTVVLMQQHHKQVRPVERMESFHGHGGPVWSLAFDSTRLFSGSYDNTIKVWDLRSHVCQATLRGHNGWVSSLFLFHDALISSSWDADINVWSLSGRPTLTRSFRGIRGNAVYNIHLDPWSRKLLAGCRNSTVNLWDVETGVLDFVFVGHSKFVYSVQLDKDIAMTGSGDKLVKVWDRRSGTCVMDLAGHSDSVMCIQFGEDHKVVSGSYDKTLRTWDLRCPAQSINVLEGHSSAVFALQFDHEKIISGSADKTLKIWNFAT